MSTRSSGIRFALLLWALAACASGSSAPPGPRPSGVNSPTASPVAWTVEETATELLQTVARASSSGRERRLVTVYYVHDVRAVDLLSDWFRRQQGVASVGLNRTDGPTHVSGVAGPEVGAVDIADQQWWEVIVEGPATRLSPDHVRAWVRLLRAAPTDFRWRLGPSLVAEP